jgi:hypothetical protein
MYTAELVAPDHSCFKVEVTIKKLKRYKSPVTYEIWWN